MLRFLWTWIQISLFIVFLVGLLVGTFAAMVALYEWSGSMILPISLFISLVVAYIVYDMEQL